MKDFSQFAPMPAMTAIGILMLALSIGGCSPAGQVATGDTHMAGDSHMEGGDHLAADHMEGSMASHMGDHGVPDEAAVIPNPIPASEASLAAGAAAYATNCATCHGPEGEGDGPGAAALNPKPANLGEDHVQANSDGALFYIISRGREGTAMPAWEAILDEETRWHLVNFLRTLSKE